MKAIIIVFGIFALLAGLGNGEPSITIVGIVALLVGISMKSKAEKEKENEEKRLSVPLPAIPKRDKPLEDVDLKEATTSNKIINRFKNNDFCKTLIKELTEDDLYKTIEVYEDKIMIDKKKYVYEDYGLRELELNDTSLLANYLGINLTNNSSYLIEKIKNTKDKTIGYKVYKNK